MNGLSSYFQFYYKRYFSSSVVSAAPRKCCLDNCFHCLRKSPSDAPMGSQHFQFIKASIYECMYSAENVSASKKGLKKA